MSADRRDGPTFATINGGDPATAKQEERRAETFADLAKEYIERYASNKLSGREDKRLDAIVANKRTTVKLLRFSAASWLPHGISPSVVFVRTMMYISDKCSEATRSI